MAALRSAQCHLGRALPVDSSGGAGGGAGDPRSSSAPRPWRWCCCRSPPTASNCPSSFADGGRLLVVLDGRDGSGVAAASPEAEERLSSSLTGLLIAAVPLVGALLARLSGDEDRFDREADRRTRPRTGRGGTARRHRRPRARRRWPIAGVLVAAGRLRDRAADLQPVPVRPAQPRGRRRLARHRGDRLRALCTLQPPGASVARGDRVARSASPSSRPSPASSSSSPSSTRSGPSARPSSPTSTRPSPSSSASPCSASPSRSASALGFPLVIAGSVLATRRRGAASGKPAPAAEGLGA